MAAGNPQGWGAEDLMSQKKETFWSVLWVLEIMVALFPAGLLMVTAGVSYVFLLTVVPKLVQDPNPAAVTLFLRITFMFVGGILGLASLVMAFDPDLLRSNLRLRGAAVVFAFAGICAEGVYVLSEGLPATASSLFATWAMLGPLLLGIHCAYRVFRRNPANEHHPG